MGPPLKPSSGYRPELDGLRAIAVVPVILFHADSSSAPGGYLGVDVFFLISGYLITRILLIDLAQQRWSIAAFYARRARRILPALLTVIVLCLPAAVWILPPDELKFMGHSLAWLGGLSSNVFFWRKLGYFAPTAEYQLWIHTWSLAVEEQFYLVYPAILGLIWRRWPLQLPWCLGGLAMLALGTSLWVAQGSPETAFYLLPFRGWELLTGAVLAWVSPPVAAASEQHGAPVRWRAVTASAGLCLLLACLALPATATLFAQQTRTGLAVLGGALVIGCASERCFTGRLLASRPLLAIGLISYSAYLWHQPLVALLRHAEVPYFVRGPVAMLACTLALAALTWRFVEQPWRKPTRAPQSRVLATALFSLLALWGVGYAIHRSGGLESWLTNARYRQTALTAAPSPMRAACHASAENYLPPAHACQYHGASVRWAALGDSHMVELAQALALQLQPTGQGLKHLTFSACYPDALDSPTPLTACNRWTRETLAYIVAQPELQSVVVAYRLNSHLFGSQFGVYPKVPDGVGAAEREARWNTLITILRRLRAADKTVYLVLQAPELPKPLKTALYQSAGALPIKGVSRAWWMQREAFVHRRLSELPAGVRVIDPTPLFCDKLQCWATEGTDALYFDADHMSVKGADRVARAILETAARQP